MALKKCKECGNTISSKAVNCPSCGAQLKKKTHISCLGAIFVLIVIAIAGMSISNSLNKPAKQRTIAKGKTAQKPAVKKPAKKTQAERQAENIRKVRIAMHGEPPENSAWDGSVRCVKRYLEKIVKDPDSLKFGDWGKVMYNDKDGWLVWCEYRAKNSFGGYVRRKKWFVIQNNRVIAMKDLGAYK